MTRQKRPTIAVKRKTPAQKRAADEMLEVLTSSTATAAALAETCQAIMTDATARFSLVASAALVWRDRGGDEQLGIACGELASVLKDRSEQLMKILERIVPLAQGKATVIEHADAIERLRPLMELHATMQDDVD